MIMGCDYLKETGHCDNQRYRISLRKNKNNEKWECLYKEKKRCPLYDQKKWFKDLAKLLRLLYPKNHLIDWKFNKGKYEVVRSFGYWMRGITTQLVRSKDGKNYRIIQYCDNEDWIEIPMAWGKKIMELDEPKVRLEWF